MVHGIAGRCSGQLSLYVLGVPDLTPVETKEIQVRLVTKAGCEC